MSNLADIIHILPSMKFGKELMLALKVLPEYDDAIRSADSPTRLMALTDLYKIYVPNQMSVEIYSNQHLVPQCYMREWSYNRI